MFSRQTPPQTHPATGAHAQPSQGISDVHKMRTTHSQKKREEKKSVSLGFHFRRSGGGNKWVCHISGFFFRGCHRQCSLCSNLSRKGGGAQKRKWIFSSPPLSPISKALCAPQVTPRKRPQRNLLTQGTGKRVERGGIRQCSKISEFLFAFSFSGKVHVW